MYHYTESSLANAWLANGYKIKHTNYGDAVAVDDMDGLHLAIAKNLIKKRRPDWLRIQVFANPDGNVTNRYCGHAGFARAKRVALGADRQGA